MRIMSYLVATAVTKCSTPVDGSKPTAYFQNQKRYHKDTDTYYWDYYIEKLKSHWYQGIMYSKDYEEQ